MNLKDLFNDDDAVSPVIGVILMVAITVILAAVIGTFVLGLGNNLNKTSPSSSITFSQSSGNAPSSITISHDGGDPLKEGTISISIDTESISDSSPVATWEDSTTDDGEITAGETVTLTSSESDSVFENGDVVKVVWTASDGSTSSVIGEHEVK